MWQYVWMCNTEGTTSWVYCRHQGRAIEGSMVWGLSCCCLASALVISLTRFVPSKWTDWRPRPQTQSVMIKCCQFCECVVRCFLLFYFFFNLRTNCSDKSTDVTLCLSDAVHPSQHCRWQHSQGPHHDQWRHAPENQILHGTVHTVSV